jgi:hypothetical protein
MPYISSRGNSLLNSYTRSASDMAFCQTFSSRYELIAIALSSPSIRYSLFAHCFAFSSPGKG